ncbi:Uncharacterised protein [Mycobacteroides abscessus subsp. abscessus]|nr:Uncharacterised protein [Mycobacteroides abscessus subsp. abscessus]
MGQVDTLAAGQLAPFAIGDLVELYRGHAHAAHDVVVQDHFAAAGDGSHRVFLVSGHSELTHDQYRQRGVQGRRDFPPHWYPAARQRQDHDVAQLAGCKHAYQYAAGVLAITEHPMCIRHGSVPG